MQRKSSTAVDSLDCTIKPKGKKGPTVIEVRLDMYFDKKGKDFRYRLHPVLNKIPFPICLLSCRLLMNLLSETSGLSHSLRILTVFDKHFQRLWRARDIKLIVEDDARSNVGFDKLSISNYLEQDLNISS